jgi:mono/diheme cytochrome c family protein
MRGGAAGRAVVVLLALGGLAGCGRAGAEDVDHDGYGYLADDYPRELRTGEHTLTRRSIARGDSLYQRTTGNANCVFCHGPFLAGSSEGTNLRDRRWHHGDGSYAFLVQVITHGTVDAPRSPIPPMPPLGGVPLSQRDVEALAAYVYWFVNTREPWEFEPRRPDDLEEYADAPVRPAPAAVVDEGLEPTEAEAGGDENGEAEAIDDGEGGAAEEDGDGAA